MLMTYATLQAMTGPIKAGSKQEANARSFLEGLNTYGEKAGLNTAVRLSRYVGQVTHENHDFRYDRELWGRVPTKAQARYDIRTDLGNTPERDGDGFLYRGRGPIQITGKSNYRQFTQWCRKRFGKKAPDFVKNPDLVTTDPWEGLVAIWYWETRNLNKWADQGDDNKVTRVINGGTNGLDDRLRRTDRALLVLLGFDRNDVRGFQIEANLTPDGKSGPNTRRALHREASKLAPLTSPRPKSRDAVAGAAGAAAVAVGVSFWESIQTGIAKAWCAIDAIPLINVCGG